MILPQLLWFLPLGARQHLLPSEADDVDVVAASDDDDTIAWHANDGSRSLHERLVATLADAIGRRACALDVYGGDVLLPSEADDVDVVAASDDDDTIAWHANDGSRSFNERLVATLADAIGRPSALDVWRAVRGREELGARGELGAREELGAHEELGAREELGALVFRGG